MRARYAYVALEYDCSRICLDRDIVELTRFSRERQGARQVWEYEGIKPRIFGAIEQSPCYHALIRCGRASCRFLPTLARALCTRRPALALRGVFTMINLGVRYDRNPH